MHAALHRSQVVGFCRILRRDQSLAEWNGCQFQGAGLTFPRGIPGCPSPSFDPSLRRVYSTPRNALTDLLKASGCCQTMKCAASGTMTSFAPGMLSAIILVCAGKIRS